MGVVSSCPRAVLRQAPSLLSISAALIATLELLLHTHPGIRKQLFFVALGLKVITSSSSCSLYFAYLNYATDLLGTYGEVGSYE